MSTPPSSFALVADAQRPGQGVLVDPHEHQGCVVVPGQHHAHLVAIELVFHFPFHAHQRAGLHHPAAAVDGVGAHAHLVLERAAQPAPAGPPQQRHHHRDHAPPVHCPPPSSSNLPSPTPTQFLDPPA